ncbi:AAA family ATPase [Photobacterium phosphoreum]|uniref:AAA family ATPase n=1 Tax=Photobacterium phosphoreum TaxID=659 RepID=A0AAW4ZRL7_PHOPO|nr:AAA family ATPase [Photobacterium phosphoreum]MCD9489398.1 AAA family ATPase [Photobacterium phosphoreum]MCF2188892.1 AAA family ATPase [Photobacterium phosphoreum]MCF2300535.1 AAA family ATPase [Photobacterium phosphoreum]
MTKKLFIACAGAGKTTQIVEESIALTEAGTKVLIITYTRSNQNELLKKFEELGGRHNELFVVKGWYSFILEDVIRPYQQCIFSKRIGGVYLNSNNPHIREGRNISGRGEKIDARYNPKHYLTSKNQAHTEFIAKLACRIIKTSKVDISERIGAIYGRIYLDETQDFAGWDFDLIKLLTKSKELDIHALGDFRQTIYHTSSKPKKPASSAEKRVEYVKMGFEIEEMNNCRRSVASICAFADTVHAGEGYTATVSKVDTPKNVSHIGIHYVAPNNIDLYIKQHNPLILRHSANSGKMLDKYDNLMTFGESKGKTTEHVLIHPTEPFIKFLKGHAKPFGASATATSQNKLYVAITRARYSVAFIVEEDHFKGRLWQPTN